MLYLITYELGSDKDYTGLYEAIKSYGTWWHYIDATWIVKTTSSAGDIANRIRPHIDEIKDSFLVIKIDPSSKQGWLPAKAYDWINNNK